MSIFRIQKSTNYIVMDKTSLQDQRLSWKAKGLHAYMLSMPNDWKFYDVELEQHAKDGKDALKTALKELKQYGYLKREQRRNDEGKFDWETLVFEQPCTENPSMEKPSVEKPLMENPSMENPQLLSIKELNNKKLSNKELNNKEIYIRYAEFVTMKESEYQKLLEQYGQNLTDKMIEVLDNYKGANGKKYKSDYRAILNWVAEKVMKETKRPSEPKKELPRAYQSMKDWADQFESKRDY